MTLKLSVSSIAHALSGLYLNSINKLRVSAGKGRLPPNSMRKYLLKTSVTPALAIAGTSLLLSTCFGRPPLLESSLGIMALLIMLPYLVELSSYISYSRKLKEDLTYFAIIEGVSPGEDLVRGLEETREIICEHLKSLCNEYDRLRLYVKFFPGMRGVKEYLARAPKPMKKMLLEYMVARENASFGTWIYTKFREGLHELKVSSRRALELKVVLSVAVIVFNGLSPPLLTLLAALGGSVPSYAYFTLAIPSIVLALSEGLSPAILKVAGGARKLQVIVALATVVFLALPLLVCEVGLLTSGIVLTALGLLTLPRTLRAYSALFSIPSTLVSLTEKLPYARDPKDLVEKSLGRQRDSSCLAALCYIALMKSVRQGEVNTARIVAFRDVVEELFATIKQGTMVRTLALATAVTLPAVMKVSVDIVSALSPPQVEVHRYCFISSVAYSVAASIIAFGGYHNTIVVGVVLLVLYLLGVAPC